MTHNHSAVLKRGVLLVSILTLSAGELMAQGASPWLQAIDVLQAAFTGPYCARTEPHCHCGGRVDLRGALRRGVLGLEARP